MSDKTDSQPQHDAATAWKKLVDDQIARVEQVYAEVAKFEHKGAEQAQSAVDEWTKLTKETFTYAGQLSASFRNLALEATRNAAAFMSFKA